MFNCCSKNYDCRALQCALEEAKASAVKACEAAKVAEAAARKAGNLAKAAEEAACHAERSACVAQEAAGCAEAAAEKVRRMIEEVCGNYSGCYDNNRHNSGCVCCEHEHDCC